MEYNVIQIDLAKLGLKKDDSWFLEPLYDIHIGHQNFEAEKYVKRVNAIAEQTNRSTFIGGDIIDNIPAADFRLDTRSKDMTMFEDVEQEDAFERLTEPLINQHKKLLTKKYQRHEDPKTWSDIKIHGALMGNHEYARHYYSSQRFEKAFCKPAKLKNLEDEAVIWFEFYWHSELLRQFTAVVTHGAYGGDQSGGEVNSMQRWPAKVDADMFIVGHSHDKRITDQAQEIFKRGTGKSLKMFERTLIFANGGTFLKTHNFGIRNYPEKKAIRSRVSKIGTITIEMVPYDGDLKGHL
ncbi:hypothetical protein LCGC14_0380510 [marine sediment metagenome]|uniref:Calcineurin-like phosphoesterase domain-containing protein n=1 Tax=marine sediment metagenome TaxID=412755 RepID=A0A0F9T289_9ZZZZ